MILTTKSNANQSKALNMLCSDINAGSPDSGSQARRKFKFASAGVQFDKSKTSLGSKSSIRKLPPVVLLTENVAEKEVKAVSINFEDS